MPAAAVRLLGVVPVIAVVILAGIVAAPSKTRPCAEEFSAGFTGAPGALELGSDGNLWASERFQDQIARFDVRTKTAREFRVPEGTDLHGLVSGPDGNLWFIGLADRLGRIDVGTGEVTLFPGMTHGSEPEHSWWAPDGKLYISESGADRMAVFDPETRRITESAYNLPPNNHIHMFAEVPDGSSWWTLLDVDQIAHFDHEAQRFDKFVQMPKGSGAHWIEYVPSDSALWVSLEIANKLARYDLRTEEVEIFDLPVKAVERGGEPVNSEVIKFRPGAAPPVTITHLLNDPKGNDLWVSLGPAGLLRFDLETHEATRVGCGLTFPSLVVTMVHDRDGNLWASESVIDGPGRLARIDR